MFYEQKINDDTFWKEAWQEDHLDSIMWAVAFIWAGLVALSSNLGYLPDGDPWLLFFLGVGALLLIELAIRLLVPAQRRDLLGTLLWAGFMFLLGGWSLFWPFALIAMGAYILLRSYFRSAEISK